MGEIIFNIIIILTTIIIFTLIFEGFIYLFKKITNIDLHKLTKNEIKFKQENLLYPQQMNNLDLIIESRQQTNMAMYSSKEEYLKYFNIPIESIKVKKVTDKEFFNIKNFNIDNYYEQIIFRNSFMFVLKITTLKEYSKEFKLSILEYKLVWREINE